MVDAPHNPLEGERPEIKFNLHDGTEEQVAIIVVHKDRPEHLNICLQSIAVTSSNSNYELIVVDNASGPDSQQFLDAIEKTGVKVIRNSKNLYWSAAANAGAAAADKNAKYFIFMHCDVVVIHPAWIDLLINVAEGYDCGMVSTEMGSYFFQNQKMEFLQEWCCLFTRKCWEDIKPYPEQLPLIGHSFIMTYRANHKGYKAQMVKVPICHHYRIVSADYNELELLQEQAVVTIPKLMRDFVTKES